MNTNHERIPTGERGICGPAAALSALAMILVLAAPGGAVRADLLISINDYRSTSATTGTFEIILANQGSDTAYVSGFSIDLGVLAASGLTFTEVSTETGGTPYIFYGSGTASVDPNFEFATIQAPPIRFTAGDADWSPDYNFTTPVAAGASVGLALVSYEIASDAPPGVVTLAFGPTGTSATAGDAGGNPIDVSTRDGSIVVAGPPAVPEPASAALLACGVSVCYAARKWSRRVAKRT